MSNVINSILSNKMVEIARYRCDKMRAHDDTNLYKWKLKMKSKHDAVLFLIPANAILQTCQFGM